MLNLLKLGVLLLFVFVLLGCGQPQSASTPSALQKHKQQELEQAILFVESSLRSLSSVGYTQWTPTTAAQEVVKIMNASQVTLSAEEERYREAEITPKTIPHLFNEKPTQSWSIVVRPDETKQVVVVEGYGTDLEEPVLMKELPCCL